MNRKMDGWAGRIGGLLTAVLVLWLPWSVPAAVRINEVMADNANALFNDGNYPDWIELYNTGTSETNLGGWSLTDTTNTTRKYVIPGGTILPANGYLVVFCNPGAANPGPLVNTNFALRKKGGFVALYERLADGGKQQDQVSYGLQVTDLSIGRVPDGTGSWVLTASTPGAANATNSLASPFGHLIFNEWMATNSSGPDWLELYNNSTNPVALAGLVFTSVAPPGVPLNRPMTNLSFIAGGDFLRLDCVGNNLAKDADELDFKLSHNTGETVSLYLADRSTLINQISFPGINLVPGFWAPDVSYGWLPDGMTNRLFKFGSVPGGIGTPTPGASNFAPITNVVVSEVLSHTDLPLEDAIELYNPTATPADISGWWISNEKDNFRKYWVPANTVIAPHGFKVFYEWAGMRTNVGFNPNGAGTNRSFSMNSARGDSVYVFATDGTTNLTGFRTGESFGPAPNGVSFGRYVTSDGKVDFVLQSRLTFGTSVTREDPTNQISVFRTGLGATNAYPRMGPLVINEIMYHPPDIIVSATNRVDDSTNEFIEIYNPTADPVALYDTNGFYYDNNIPPWDVIPFADGRTNTWRLRGEVDFEFPTNLVLNAGRYLLLVNFSPTNTAELEAFRQRYSIPTNFNRIFGPYRGKLGNGSGSIELQRPDTPQGPSQPEDFVDRLVPYYLVEGMKYYDSAPWPTNADGGGYSLQRLRPEEYGNDPTNWTSTLPSPGRPTDTNSPPELASITNVTIDEFKLLIFTNVATDPNLGQTLVYTLDAGAPLRAQVNQAGVFSWRPLEADGPGDYPITVRVTDNGIPPRSATQSFTVTVREVNQPPVFNIREKWVKAGTTLTFPTAFDHDLPAQALAFSKTAGPPGASVDATNGIVSWSPSDADVGTSSLTIRAEDNGEPPLSASFTYTVHVLASSATLVVAEDVVIVPGSTNQISWEATVDKLYEVEWTDDLGSGIWFSLGDAVRATQTRMTLPDPDPLAWVARMRFYRISQLD